MLAMAENPRNRSLGARIAVADGDLLFFCIVSVFYCVTLFGTKVSQKGHLASDTRPAEGRPKITQSDAGI